MDSKPASFRVLLSILILIVLVVLAVAYLPFLSGVRSWWGIVTAPAEVRTAAYLGTEDGVGVAYTAGLFGLTKHSYDGYSVVDYGKRGKTEVALLRKGGAYDLYDVSGAAPKALTDDGKEKSSLDLSPDGSLIAYGSKDRTLPPPAGAADETLYNLNEWRVHVYDVALGSEYVVGPGNFPRFYKDGLFYPIPGGFIYRVAGADGYNGNDEGGALEDASAYRVMMAPHLSAEGRYSFRNVLASSFDVLSLESSVPLSLAQAPENPVAVPGGTSDLVTGGGRSYILSTSAAGAGIFRLTDDAPATLFTFPAGFVPVGLTNIH